MRKRQVLCTGEAVLREIHANIQDNLTEGYASDLSLPSLRDLALAVVNEDKVLTIVDTRRSGGSGG